MRNLTASEKRLALLLGVILFLGINAIVITFYNRVMSGMKQDIVTLQNEKILASVWLDERDLWTSRKAWLDANQPALPEDGSAGSSLLEDIQSSAVSNSLTIQKQSLLNPVATPEYQESSVSIRINGSLENVTRWLASIQAPEKFQAIRSFKLTSDKEPPKVICDLVISRLYQP